MATRNGGSRSRSSHTLRPVFVKQSAQRSVGPDVCFTDLANRVVQDEFLDHTSLLSGLCLVPHLRRHTRLSSRGRQLARLPNRVRQGLFAIDMFAKSNGDHRSVKVMYERTQLEES